MPNMPIADDDKLYRAEIVYQYTDHNNNVSRKSIKVGPYTTHSALKGMITREISYAKRYDDNFAVVSNQWFETGLVWNEIDAR